METSVPILTDISMLSVGYRRVGIFIGYIDDEVLIALVAVALLGSLLLPPFGLQVGKRRAGP